MSPFPVPLAMLTTFNHSELHPLSHQPASKDDASKGKTFLRTSHQSIHYRLLAQVYFTR
jgi:hypothetical protein